MSLHPKVHCMRKHCTGCMLNKANDKASNYSYPSVGCHVSILDASSVVLGTFELPGLLRCFTFAFANSLPYFQVITCFSSLQTIFPDQLWTQSEMDCLCPYKSIKMLLFFVCKLVSAFWTYLCYIYTIYTDTKNVKSACRYISLKWTRQKYAGIVGIW